jgi:hypothetical protein
MIRSIFKILMVSLVSAFILSACTKNQDSGSSTSTETTTTSETTTTGDAAPMPSSAPDAAAH